MDQLEKKSILEIEYGNGVQAKYIPEKFRRRYYVFAGTKPVIHS